MTVAEHISSISPIDEHSSRLDCLELMYSNVCFELPVLRDGKPYGTVQLDECAHSEEKTIASLVDVGCTSIYYNTHIIDALRILNSSGAQVCAVQDRNFNWLGILTKNSVLEALSASLTVEQPGAILVVEMASHQYSNSQISMIVENEGAQLLGLWIVNVEESGRIRASLKLNTPNAERIINSLHRYNYEVISTFGDDDYNENVEKRFQSLMNYIDF